MKFQILKCDNVDFKIVGWLIKKIQKTNCSHYAIGFTSHTGEYMILDSTSKNVALRSTKHFKNHYKIISQDTMEINYSYEDFSTWYEPLLGESYGYIQLLGILIKNKSMNTGIVCNELVLRLLKRFTSYTVKNIDILDLNDTSRIVNALKIVEN